MNGCLAHKRAAKTLENMKHNFWLRGILIGVLFEAIKTCPGCLRRKRFSLNETPND